MAIRNNHWYNLNEQRYYPLDDTASAISDQGSLLPSSLIVDLRLRWPLRFGRYAFVSAATITPYLVTVLIEACDTLDNSSGSQLIAGITLPRSELTLLRTYPLQAFQPGVGGFIAFGEIDLPPYSGRFSSPRQSLLTPRAARASRTAPIPVIGIESAGTPLTGLINLVAVPPLKLTKTSRYINGVEQQNVLVFSLAQNPVDGPNTATPAVSVFSEFAGPCGKRVGSRTCGDPQPIESINGVTADSNGVITLDFSGCAVLGHNEADCGVIVDCELGLSQSCTPPYLPNLQTGELPNEAAPVVIRPTLPPVLELVEPYSISESMHTALSLPYCDTFDDQQAPGFLPLADSVWDFVQDDSPEEGGACEGVSGVYLGGAYAYGTPNPIDQGLTNISLWGMDVQTLFRTYTTDVKILSAGKADPKNAGILINYRTDLSGVVTYLVALLDVQYGLFGIYFFNGMQLVPLVQAELTDLRTEDWYRIRFTSRLDPQLHKSIALSATLDGITDPTITAELTSSLSTALWWEDSGLAGLYTRRSASYFAFWRVDEVS